VRLATDGRLGSIALIAAFVAVACANGANHSRRVITCERDSGRPNTCVRRVGEKRSSRPLPLGQGRVRGKTNTNRAMLPTEREE
jgi:hypothetical protein